MNDYSKTSQVEHGKQNQPYRTTIESIRTGKYRMEFEKAEDEGSYRVKRGHSRSNV